MRIQEFLWIVCFLLMSLFVHGIPVDTMELKVGDRCPAFTFEDMEGQSRSLDEFKGKYVFIDVWASWCYPCRKEYPYCKNWKRNLKDKMSCLWAFPVIMSCGGGKGQWKTGKCRESSGGLEMILLS